MKRHKVKIGATLRPNETENYIEIDGERMTMVQSVKLEMGVYRVPVVTVSFIPEEVEIEGDAMVADHSERARQAIASWPDWKREPYEKLLRVQGLDTPPAPPAETPYGADWSGASLLEIVKQLEYCGYGCEAGMLTMNTAFIELKRRAAYLRGDTT